MGYHIPFIPFIPFPYEVWDFLMGIFCTVDGRNPAPVEVGSLSHLAPSQVVVWDFFHQDYLDI